MNEKDGVDPFFSFYRKFLVKSCSTDAQRVFRPPEIRMYDKKNTRNFQIKPAEHPVSPFIKNRLEQENMDRLSRMAQMLRGKQKPLDRFKLHG